MIFLSEDGIMFLIYAIPGLFNPSLNIILTHFWDEIILWEAVEIIVEITPRNHFQKIASANGRK